MVLGGINPIPYHYHGYWTDGGICDVVIGGRPERPAIMVSERDDNENTSVTNMAEYLAAELIARYFPDHHGPFDWIEHYPAGRGCAAGEHYDRVTFASYTPQRVGTASGVRSRLGEPRWQRISEDEARRLLHGEKPEKEDE